MEDTVFPRPAVAGILGQDYIEARIHTDHREKGAEHRKLQSDMVGFVSAPYYVVVDPKTGKKLAEHKLSGSDWDVNAEEFAAFLKNASQTE